MHVRFLLRVELDPLGMGDLSVGAYVSNVDVRNVGIFYDSLMSIGIRAVYVR